MNPMRDQSGSPYGDSTPRSPFSPYSGDERHRNLADSKRDTTTPRSPFSPFSPLSGDERHKTLAESKFQQALPCSGTCVVVTNVCLCLSMYNLLVY